MTKDEITEELRQLIKASAAGTGMVGSLSDEFGKARVFRLFQASNDSGESLTGAYLTGRVRGLNSVVGDPETVEDRLLLQVCGWWDEWRYAIAHFQPQLSDD